VSDRLEMMSAVLSNTWFMAGDAWGMWTPWRSLILPFGNQTWSHSRTSSQLLLMCNHIALIMRVECLCRNVITQRTDLTRKLDATIPFPPSKSFFPAAVLIIRRCV